MKEIQHKCYGGQSMFEVVLALFIMAMIIVGVVFLSTNSIANSSFSKNKTIAGRYSQEAVEWLRGQRDSDSTLFKTNAVGSYCFDSSILTWSNSGLCSSGELLNNLFKREVTFTTTTITGKNLIEAKVVTSWNDSKGTHQSKSVTQFTDIREK